MSLLKIELCNPDINTTCWGEMSTAILHCGNNLQRSYAKNEKCNKPNKYTSVASAARRQMVGGCGGGVTFKNRRRRPRIVIVGGFGAARPSQRCMNWRAPCNDSRNLSRFIGVHFGGQPGHVHQ